MTGFWSHKCRAFTGFAVAIGYLFHGAAVADDGKLRVGWIEKVRIMPSGLSLEAKLDTGADNSSLNATGIRMIKRRGRRWVAFQLTNKAGVTVELERPIIRTTRIKSHAGKRLGRPVIALGIYLGSVFREVEVNLSERKKFNFNMLIGRSFLEGRVLVDSARKYTTEPSCPEVENR